jgi:[NiFe] hydrogenase diaphorase moiety large subunit
MLTTERDQLRDQVIGLADKLGRNRSSLIPILQDVKKNHHGMDSYAMQLIADTLDIHPVEVYSTASFYAFLRPTTQGDYVFRLCRTLSCELQGKDAVEAALAAELDIAFDETSADGRFTLEWANCMGMCDQGPALLVNDRVYTQVTPEKVREIVQECRASYAGHVTERKEEHLV